MLTRQKRGGGGGESSTKQKSAAKSAAPWSNPWLTRLLRLWLYAERFDRLLELGNAISLLAAGAEIAALGAHVFGLIRLGGLAMRLDGVIELLLELGALLRGRHGDGLVSRIGGLAGAADVVCSKDRRAEHDCAQDGWHNHTGSHEETPFIS